MPDVVVVNSEVLGLAPEVGFSLTYPVMVYNLLAGREISFPGVKYLTRVEKLVSGSTDGIFSNQKYQFG
jgi:hypothetical protein